MTASMEVGRLVSAVVVAADGVRFTAVAPDDEGLAEQLVGYISSRCDDTLWPDDAVHVRRLIDQGRAADAIAAYFATVGDRWDAEELRRPLNNPDCHPERSEGSAVARS